MKKYFKLIGMLAFCTALVVSFASCGFINLDAPDLTEIVQDAEGSRSGKVKWNVAYDQTVYFCFTIGIPGTGFTYSSKTTAEQGSVSFVIPSSVPAGTYTVSVQAWYEPSDKVIDKYETLAGPEATKEAKITIN